MLIDEYDFLALTLIRGSLAHVQDEFRQYLEGRTHASSKPRYSLSTGRFDPRLVYSRQPQPGGAIPVLSAVWEPSTPGGVVAFMPNSSDGRLQLIRHFCGRYPHRECLSLQTSKPEATWPRNAFHCFQNGNEIRAAAAWKDVSGWQFGTRGTVQPFEDVSHYQQRRIHDRVNRETIIEYTQRFGADISDNGFWTSGMDAFWFKERWEGESSRTNSESS